MTVTNHDAAAKQFRSQKAALTRAKNSAKNSGKPSRVIRACWKATQEWGGGWPDSWSNWNIAFRDALGWRHPLDLEDLARMDEAGMKALARRADERADADA